MNKWLQHLRGDRYTRNENLTYLFAWILVFSLPWIAGLYSTKGLEYRHALRGSINMLPYLAIFLLNNIVLMRYLFVPGRKAAYFASVLAVLIAVWAGINPPPPPPFITHASVEFAARMFHTKNVELAAGVIFANIAIKMYFVSHRKDIEMLKVRNGQMQSELESLKYQINPHFLMNTLNNIQSLIEVDPAKAYDTIQELSRMMRYVLYDNSGQMVPLSREIEVMKNFIALMRIRYPEHVVISFAYPEDTGTMQVPPLLLITFVENAFKHGISYKGESMVAIDIQIKGERLFFRCMNSNPGKKPQKPGGIGLENVKRRLALIYGKNYKLDIEDGKTRYLVELEL